MGKKPNPDDRRDNVEKIRRNIDNTIKKMEAAEDMIRLTDSGNTKRELKEKNKRRQVALQGMRKEIREEALHRKKQKGERD